MAPGNFTKTTTGLSVCRQALLYAGVTDNDFLGETASDCDSLDAVLLKRLETEILDRCPKLAVSSTATVTIASGSNEVALPAAMWGLRLKTVKINDPGGDNNDTPIQVVSTREWRERITADKEDFPTDMLRFAAPNEDMSKLLIDSPASEAIALTIVVNTGPTAYTSARTEVSAIPDAHIDTLVFRLAAEYATIMNKQDVYQLRMGQFEQAMARLDKALKLPSTSARLYDVGYAPNPLDHIPDAGLMRRVT